jgi:hypothetical protein
MGRGRLTNGAYMEAVWMVYGNPREGGLDKVSIRSLQGLDKVSTRIR